MTDRSGSRTLRYAVLVILAIGAPLAVHAEDSLPEGLHWQELTRIRGKLAVPDGWEFAVGGTSTEPTYRVSPPGSSASFSLSVKRGHDVTRVESEARSYVANECSRARCGAIDSNPMGRLLAFSSLAEVTDKRIALTGIGNTRTGTVYLIRFEVPMSEWDKIWPLGRFLVGKFILEDEE